MTQEQILWLVIGLVVLIVVIAIIAAVVSRRRRQQREADRASADHLRRDAALQHDRLAAEAEQAESARLEAEAAEANARRLREEAEQRERAARESERSLDEQLRTADRLDPEVETDRDGRRKDGTDPKQTLTGAAAGVGTQEAQDRPDDGHAPAHEGAGTDSFRPVPDETAEEHALVERRMAADPSAEPSESVAACADRPVGSHQDERYDGEQVVDPELDPKWTGTGTAPVRRGAETRLSHPSPTQ